MSQDAESNPEKKNLFWTVRIANAMPNWRDYLKQERYQYRTDVKALLCRGNMPEKDTQRIQMALNFEWVVFGLSRAFVPLCLFVMYRRGIF